MGVCRRQCWGMPLDASCKLRSGSSCSLPLACPPALPGAVLASKHQLMAEADEKPLLFLLTLPQAATCCGPGAPW